MDADEFIKRLSDISSEIDADLAIDYELFFSIRDFSINFENLKTKLMKKSLNFESFIKGLMFLYPYTKFILFRVLQDFPEEFFESKPSLSIIAILQTQLEGLCQSNDKSFLNEKLSYLEERLNDIEPVLIKLNDKCRLLAEKLEEKIKDKQSLEEKIGILNDKLNTVDKVIKKLGPERNRLEKEVEIIKEHLELHIKKEEIENRLNKISEELERVKKEYFPDDKAMKELKM